MNLTYKTAPQYAANILRFHLGEHLWDRITTESRNHHTARILANLWKQIEDREKAVKQNRETSPVDNHGTTRRKPVDKAK